MDQRESIGSVPGGGTGRLGAVSVDGGAYDRLDVFGIESQGLADMHRPDLRAEVVLEVEVATNIRPGGLTVLAHHHECREEDRFETHHHGEEPVGERVEDHART